MRGDRRLRRTQRRVIAVVLTMSAAGFLAGGVAVPDAPTRSVVVTGRVTDTARAPLRSVQAFLPEMRVGGATDRAGRFRFAADLAPGDHRLLIRAIGFRSAERRLVVAERDTLLDVGAVALAPDVVRLDDLVTGYCDIQRYPPRGRLRPDVRVERLRDSLRRYWQLCWPSTRARP